MVHLPAMRAGKRDSQGSAQRVSVEVRADPAAGSPAKARMLWREGFTPLEMANSSMNAKEMKRQEVIFEIIHTEADYVRDLRLTAEVLLDPLRSLRIVPAEQVDLIFGNIGEILALHEEINAAFMERQRQQYPVVWDISDVLLPFVAGFRVYARYICNQDRALALVEQLKSECNNFAVFWRERQKRPECRGLPMESFLALPFQRLLKYPLLLRTLLDATEGWAQQYANGTAVAEQIGAWITKIQDAQTKLDSFACIDALSRAVAGVDWAPLAGAEHRLAHAGPVAASLRTAGVLAPEQAATMWLFDTFALIAAGDSAGARGFMPAPGARYTAVLRPSRIVEVLELAQRKGKPAALVRAVPADAPAQTVSLVLGFASRADYTLWRAKLDEHVRHTLAQDPGLSADILADAIARARIVDSEPTQCAGVVRTKIDSGLTSANASVSDIPSISVRDVYVEFPVPQRRGRLRRGWDMLRTKTEDLTGSGIKHQLRKYGGGKRRATELPKPAEPPKPATPRRLPRVVPKRESSLAPPKPSAGMISTPIVPLSPSFVHIPRTAGPSAANGGHESAFVPPRRPLPALPASTYHPRQAEKRASAMSVVSAEVTSPLSMHHQLLLSSLEFGTAATACATGAPQSMSARSSFTGRTLSNAPVGGAGSAWADHYGSDSDCSGSEASAMFPEHVAERSGSTLFSPLHASHSQLAAPPRAPADPPKPLPVPPRGARHQPGARKPAPIFEVGSARLTYGPPAQPPAAVCKAQGHRDRTGSLPLANDPPAAPRPPGDRWQTAFREPARGWPATGADASLRVDSTESFCIISPVSPQQGSDHHSRTRTLI